MALAERTIEIHLTAGALTQDQIGQALFQARMQRRPVAIPQTVIRPQRLQLRMLHDRLERQLARMLAGKAHMVSGVPTVGRPHITVASLGQQGGDRHQKLIVVFTNQRTAGPVCLRHARGTTPPE